MKVLEHKENGPSPGKEEDHSRRLLLAGMAFMGALLAAIPHHETVATANPLLPVPRQEPAWSRQQHRAGYAIWSGDFTVPFFENIPPLAEQLASAPGCVSSAGEYEPLVIGIWALRDLDPVRLSVSSSRFKIKTSRVLFEERSVPPAPQKGRRLGIPLFLPEEAKGPLRAGRNTVFWLTVFIAPETAAGIYQEKLTLTLRHTPSGPKESIEVPFTVEVLPFKLPRADIAFGMYHLLFRIPEAYRSADYEQMYFEDMAAHGHTSAFIPSTAGELGFDHTGKVNLSGTLFERNVLAQLKAGLLHEDVPVMMYGHSTHDHPGRYTEFARELKKACRKRGWPEMVLYAPDEPRAEGKRRYEEKFGKGSYMRGFEELNAARSQMRTITAIFGEEVKTFGKYLSVWVVRSGTITRETLRLARELKRELWTYDCDHRGTNPAYQRFYPGLHTWALGLKGNFLWAYNHSAQFSWEQDRTCEHSYVSPSKAGPVSMVGWEARREGIEDYRCLSYLEQLVGQEADHPLAGEAGDWLANLRKRVNVRLWTDEDAKSLKEKWSNTWWDIADLYNPNQEIDVTEYQLIRQKAQRYIARLSGKN